MQQFADSLRPSVDGAPTHKESLTSHSETTDWKLYKSALVLDVLQKASQKKGNTHDSSSLNNQHYVPSNGNGVPNTRFLNTAPDSMIHYLQARKKQREYIKTHTAKLKHAQTASQMKKTNKHSTTPVKPINDSDINEMMRRAPTVPVSPLCKRKLLLKQKQRKRTNSEEMGWRESHHNYKPIVPTGARKAKNVPSSKFWSLHTWSSRPPLALEHRRILGEKEIETMDSDREKRFREILRHQIYEGLSTFDNRTAFDVLSKSAGGNRSNCMRTSLRLTSVNQMYDIINGTGEEVAGEEDEIYLMGKKNVTT